MRLLVIDGNSIVNRAFYGIKVLTTKDGQFTNGIYGFLNILIRLKQECEPDHVAIAFDLKAPTFRHKMYTEYKGQRKGMPQELASQMPLLKELLTYLGYAIVEKEGFEADDILGTLSAQCKGEDKCFIATGDRDSLQLVSKNTNVLLAATRMGKPQTIIYDEDKIQEDYGVVPKQLIEIKALMGDASDNIPGVAGVGQKTAGDLIQRFNNIDEIYENIETIDIKKGVREKLIKDKENAFLSRELGTILLETPIDLNLDSYAMKPVDNFNAIQMLVKLEMFGIIDKLGLTRTGDEIINEKQEIKQIEFCNNVDTSVMLTRIKKDGKAYFTTQFENGEITAMYFAVDENVCEVCTRGVDFDGFVKKLCESEIEKYTSDIKQLYKYAISKGFELNVAQMDTSLAAYILNPSANSYEVTRLIEEHAIADIECECDEKLAETVKITAALPALCEKIQTLITANKQDPLLHEIELPLAKVLADIECHGFLVDKQGIEAYGAALGIDIEVLATKIYEQAGFEFNINSPKQLGQALFEKLGIPSKKKTKTGYSTNADVLESLAQEYPIVSDVLEYRTLAKLKSTYCDGLLKVVAEDGRIRSTLNQTETRTGRISSTEPNLQNIPVRTTVGKELRKFFIAPENYVLVDADYSQIELRVLAHMANDKVMIEAFNNNEDIHTITASQVFDMPLFMVTPLMRSRAKAVNFGIVYGIGAFSLSNDIGVTIKEADDYIKGYLHHYSGVRKYMQDVVNEARENGYANTVFNRRRYLPELSASNKNLQAFGERVAKNMPIQGSAADIIKIAMVKVFERLERENLKAKLIMQVHDELIVECPQEEQTAVQLIVREEMQNAYKMKVILQADVSCGETWYDAKT